MGSTINSFDSDDLKQNLQIINFIKHVLLQKHGNFPELNQAQDGEIFPEARGERSNRGNKLLQNSQGITSKRLKVDIKEGLVLYNGSDHNILSRKRMKFPSLLKNENDEVQNNSDSDDICNLVDIMEVLAPISSLEDIIKRPSFSKIFKNSILHKLDLDTVLMIEKEQKSVVNYSKLLDVFLGDYPEALYEENLQLEPYDHNLKLPEENEEFELNHTSCFQVKDLKSGECGDENEDPFFALPKCEIPSILRFLNDPSPDSVDEIETTRQLAQIALQRNQEFIRNLQKIRNCILKANRIRERILMWSKEMANIPEEGITVPTALHAVKRGIISATTNQAVIDTEYGDEISEE